MKEQANSVHFKLINMNKIIKNTSIFLSLCFAVSCTGIYEDGAEMAADKKSKVNSTSVDSLKKMIDNGEDLLVIDIRESSEFYTESIPGSVLISRGMLEFQIDDIDFWAQQYMYPPEKTGKIIICSKNGDLGVLSAISLTKMGYKNVSNLEGGYGAFNPNQDPNAAPKKSGGGCGGSI